MNSDMRVAIVPKSDQLNSDDLIAGPITITITKVSISAGTEQPVAISFGGDNGKPWKPCKSMSRCLVYAWGPDASKYVGKSLTLYRDPKVKWGGMEVGGIRISHMSDIDRDMVMVLTATKGKSAPFSVKVLKDAPKPASKSTAKAAPDQFDPIAWADDAESFASGHKPEVVKKWWIDDDTVTKREALYAANKARYGVVSTLVKSVTEPKEATDGEP